MNRIPFIDDQNQINLLMEVEISDESDSEEANETEYTPTISQTSSDREFEHSSESSEATRVSSPEQNSDTQSEVVPQIIQPKLETEDVAENPSKKRKLSEEDPDDGKLCSICLDNWTNTGEHRICALRCGHLFGHQCIYRWISTNKSCPTCKVKASKHDLRFIYANKLIAMDTTELNIIRKQLDMVIEEKNRIQIDLTKSICRQHMLQQDLNVYKEKVKSLTNLSSKDKMKIVKSHSLRLNHSITVCPSGTCRVMDINNHLGIFVVSLKSPNTLFQGYGIKKYNVESQNPISYIPLHTKVIRDIKFDQNNSRLLSVSLDKYVKIIDINNASTICSHETDAMLWSCSWDKNDSNHFYVGQQQGSVVKYDTRRMGEPLATYQFPGDMSPVVSIASVPSSPIGTMPFGGFLACKLNATFAFEFQNSVEYRQHLVTVEGPFYSMCYNSEDCLIFLSARPNSRYPNTRHIVLTMDGFNPIHTFSGGRLQKQLSRSCFVKQSGLSYVASQHETSVALWSLNTGKQSASVFSHNTIIDIMPLSNDRGSYLAALSEKKLEYFRFCDN